MYRKIYRYLRGQPIHPLNDPVTGKWPEIDWDNEEEYDSVRLQFGEELLELYDAQNLVLGFSPFLPIKPQIANAKRILEETQKALREKLKKEGSPWRRKRINKPSYVQIKLLRVLDAHGEGISYQKIGEEVYGIKDDHALAANEAYKHYKIAESYEDGM